ncbi:MAG TPA: nickel pincer cofactor biosynthesis protein LarC [Vicinamibacterales bacterium]|nr:nickel pincer cofactor biosynthesis protein LarC [Vicinamibacterales bacterium]
MALGALLDAGLPFDDLRRALGSLALGDAHVHAHRVLRAGVAATKFTVHAGEHADHDHRHEHHGAHEHSDGHSEEHTGGHGDKDSNEHGAHDHEHGSHHHHHDGPHEHVPHDHGSHGDRAHRSLEEIFRLIDRSSLTPQGRDLARAMFQRLGEAEAAVHQMPVERVHLHEVGAIDSIVDIVGIVHAMEWANADRVVCSPLNVGGGMVRSAHGLFPVPAPATVKLLGGVPVYSGRVQKELVTPTGALIATTFASSFGPIPPMSIERVGYGAGDRDDPVTPNVVRVLIGRESEATTTGDRVTVIECEIDDMNPQIFGIVMDRLYAAGALEVFYTPVQMKKNRPGTLLTVVAAPGRRTAMTEVIFSETTTIGLRHYDVDRECLEREIVTIETPIGPVRFKLARHNGRIVNATPEFEDCAALAREKGLSVKDVQAIAIAAYGARA